jgi:hypothetical protein
MYGHSWRVLWFAAAMALEDKGSILHLPLLQRAKAALIVLVRVGLITCGLFLVLDFSFTRTGLWKRVLNLRQSNTGAPPWRIGDPYYHHGLDRNRDVTDYWGDKPYRLTTNSLGFKDWGVREVSRVKPRCRTLFIGDSFTEGIGLAWDDTFVGMLQKQHPECELLNAAVSGYSPSIYRNKIARLLRDGFEVDRIVVFIDISDIQDEAVHYERAANGEIKDNALYLVNDSASPSSKAPPVELRSNESKWSRARRGLDRYFFVASLLVHATTEKKEPVDVFDLYRSAWTYDKNLPGYGPGGVDSGIKRAIDEMVALSDLLTDHHVKLSVAVYPWPGQLLHDQRESLQVKIWRDFCKTRCEYFLDLFPPFFDAIGGKEANTWLPEFFFNGDVHYNRNANELIANYLSGRYRSLFENDTSAR